LSKSSFLSEGKVGLLTRIFPSRSKVDAAKPNLFVILVKYYQPNHPKYQVYYTLTAGKNQYDGKFDIQHCPSSSGCRGVIRPPGEGSFEIDDEFKFTITVRA